MDIQGKLNQANGRLKAANVGITIEAKGNRLYLRAVLPPKLDSNRHEPYQQRIALGIRANFWEVKVAEAEARKVGALLDCKHFSWQPYLKQVTEPPTEIIIADWITKFEQHYFQRRARNPKSESTYHNDYWKVFKNLPQAETLDCELLLSTILKTSPDTRIRKRYCLALNALAKFAGLDLDVKHLVGSYGSKQLSPRNLPNDEMIAQWFFNIKDPARQWAYGAIATFGLRPDEIFYLDTSDLELGGYMLSVLDGKTGLRRVWAYYPEGVDLFGLRSPKIPTATARNNGDLGSRCGQYFRRAGLRFKPYDLRHCWAIRTIGFGLDVSLAAAQQGHSVRVHTELYHRRISDRHHQRAFDLLMLRSERPRFCYPVQEKLF